MKETPRVQNIILNSEKKFSTDKKQYREEKEAAIILLYQSYKDTASRIDKIDETIQQLGNVDTKEYYNLLDKREKLLAEKKSFLEDIQKETTEYNTSQRENVKKAKLELTKILKKELIRMRIRRNAIEHEQDKPNGYEEALEDLMNAITLCETTLAEFQDKKQETIDNSTEKTSDSSEKEYVEIPYFKLYDDLYGTQKKIFHLPRKNVSENKEAKQDIKSSNSQEAINDAKNPNNEEVTKKIENLNYEIIDDMEQARQDDKKISIHIAGDDFEISFSSLHNIHKNVYEDLHINEMCNKISGNGILGKIRSSHLAKKINPLTIKCLDSIGNYELIQEYIKSIYKKERFPFDILYNLKNLSRMQRWEFQRLIKSEQKSGAKIIEKSANKRNSFPDKKAFNKKMHVDGKNEEIARNFFENIQKEKEAENETIPSDFYNGPEYE